VIVYELPAARPVNVFPDCVILPGMRLYENETPDGGLNEGVMVIVPSLTPGQLVGVEDEVAVGAGPAPTGILDLVPVHPFAAV
jgi:hypothetical protein